MWNDIEYSSTYKLKPPSLPSPEHTPTSGGIALPQSSPHPALAPLPFRTPEMPASAANNRPEDLTARLGVGAGAGAAQGEALLKALREVKNQIIGNKTKKLLYLHLGAVPKIVSVLAAAAASSSSDSGGISRGGDAAVIVQAAAAIGSFACGVEDGVRAVLDAGAVPHLTSILSHDDEKVYNGLATNSQILLATQPCERHKIPSVSTFDIEALTVPVRTWLPEAYVDNYG